MAYPYTNSTVSANVVTGLSTQILIEVDNHKVGAVKQFTADQNRTIGGVGEVGTDGFIEKVPTGPTDIKLTLQRVVFDGKRLTNAFRRSFFNIHSQRVPFNIVVYDNQNATPDNPDGDASQSGQIVHEYVNCWFEQLGTPYNSDNYIITETARISVERVRTVSPNTGLSPLLGKDLATYNEEEATGANIELLADIGRRGSLDAAGLSLLLKPEGV